MRTIRLYTDNELDSGSIYSLNAEERNYAKNVLRLQAGDELVLFNGDGREYPARIQVVSKKDVTVEILDERLCDRESNIVVELGQAITKGDRMDLGIQKSVELGVSSITPLFTQHGVVSIKGDRLDKKRTHWQKVAISAAEQCGRAVVPEVAAPMGLDDWLRGKSEEQGLKLVLHPGSDKTLTKLDITPESVVLLIGPEGGLSENEVKMAMDCGFVGISLGSRILRAETATMAIMAAVQLYWGDLA